MSAMRAWVACGVALAFAIGPAKAFASTAADAVAVTSAASSPEADLRAARPFVLVVVDTGERLKRSEAYGDWQAYLAAYIERGHDGLPIHQVAPERARKLLRNWPRGLRNATLFASAQGRGLLHRGLVLEPQVYEIGEAFAASGAAKPEAPSYGLKPFNWKPR